MTEKKLLKKYVSLGDQAEKFDSYAAYKEKIDMIKNMTYEELYNLMRDTKEVLTVLARGETKAQKGGLTVLTKQIVKLANMYLDRYDSDNPKSTSLEYTYEWIEKEDNKKITS